MASSSATPTGTTGLIKHGNAMEETIGLPSTYRKASGPSYKNGRRIVRIQLDICWHGAISATQYNTE